MNRFFKAITNPLSLMRHTPSMVGGGGMSLLLPGKQGRNFTNADQADNYKSWVFCSAMRNATAIASTRLRVYATIGAGEGRPTRQKWVPLSDMEKNRILKASPTVGNSRVAQANDIVELTEHPVQELMRSINPFRNQADFMMESVLYLQCTGNCYWLIVDYKTGVQKGLPAELWILPTQYTAPIPDKNKFISGYEYGFGTEKQRLSTAQVVHYREPNIRRQLTGMGRIEAAYTAIQGYDAMEEYETATSRNPIPPLLLKYKNGSLTRAQRRELSSLWSQMLRVDNDSGGGPTVAVGDQSFDVEKLSFPPKDMSYLNGRKWRREEIVNAFGQTMALYSEQANRANVDGAIYLWARFELDPTATRIAQKINETIMPRYEESEGRVFCMFDKIAVDDQRIELDSIKAYRETAVMSANEIRTQLLGLEESDDPDADSLRNVSTASRSEVNVGRNGVPVGGAAAGVGGKLVDGGVMHPGLRGVSIRTYP